MLWPPETGVKRSVSGTDQHRPFVALKRYRLPGQLIQDLSDKRREDDAAAFLHLLLPEPPLDMGADVGARNGQQAAGRIRFDQDSGNLRNIPVGLNHL